MNGSDNEIYEWMLIEARKELWLVGWEGKGESGGEGRGVWQPMS